VRGDGNGSGRLRPDHALGAETHFITGLLIGGLIIVFFGVADDIKDLSPNVKLIGPGDGGPGHYAGRWNKNRRFRKFVANRHHAAGLGGDTAHHICRSSASPMQPIFPMASMDWLEALRC
jgi:hypothetical protein